MAKRDCQWFVEVFADDDGNKILTMLKDTDEYETHLDADGVSHDRLLRCSYRELQDLKASAKEKGVYYRAWRKQGHHRSPISRCEWEEADLSPPKSAKKSSSPVEF